MNNICIYVKLSKNKFRLLKILLIINNQNTHKMKSFEIQQELLGLEKWFSG